MRHGKFLKIMALCLTAVFLLAGCAKSVQTPPASNGAFLAVQDDAGRKVVLPRKPERIVVLSLPLLELLYAVDGKAAGRLSTVKSDHIPLQAKDVPEVGFVYNVNVEKVVSLKPDLVIAAYGRHDKLVPLLESNNIPVLMLEIRTYDDLKAKIRLLGQIAGTADKAETVVGDIEGKINGIISKLPATAKKIVILHATSKSVSVELDGTVAGSIAKMLKLNNVSTQNKNLKGDVDVAPYSLEKLVEQNPDIIFVVTMGQAADVEKRLLADVKGNPAWNTLKAVEAGKVYVLPSDLFLSNPGLRMAEAVEYMARIAYPKVFGNEHK